jgi:hypothetical protein
VLLDDIEKLIQKEDYIVHGTLTICILEVKNGTLVTGEAACVYPENYDSKVGLKVSREKAIAKLFALEGYLLAERRFSEQKYLSGG